MWFYFYPVSKISSHDIMMICDYIFTLSQKYQVMILWWCVIIFLPCLKNIKSWYYDDMWLYFHPVSKISSHDIMMMCDYIFALSQEYKVMMLWWCVIIFSSCLRNIKSWHYDDVWLYFNPVSGISSFVENLAQMLKPLPLSDCR